jgi:hypothetical protein
VLIDGYNSADIDQDKKRFRNIHHVHHPTRVLSGAI